MEDSDEEWDEVEEFEKILSLQSMACKVNSLEEEVKFLRHEIIAAGDPDKIIAESVSIREVMFLLEKAAKTNVTVLMLGETGVGKEVFSQALHQMGELAPGPFIAVNLPKLRPPTWHASGATSPLRTSRLTAVSG